MPDKKTTAALVAGGAIVAVGGSVVAIPWIGFAAAGVVKGSLAAGAQAGIGNVVAGSTFASLQSAGVLGLAASTKIAIGTAGAAAGVGISRLFS